MVGKLTPEELGDAEYHRCWKDKAWFRSIPGAARTHAAERGRFAAMHMLSATTPNAVGERVPDADFYRFQRDAVMFARMAHKGWRAYRVMVG